MKYSFYFPFICRFYKHWQNNFQLESHQYIFGIARKLLWDALFSISILKIPVHFVGSTKIEIVTHMLDIQRGFFCKFICVYIVRRWLVIKLHETEIDCIFHSLHKKCEKCMTLELYKTREKSFKFPRIERIFFVHSILIK